MKRKIKLRDMTKEQWDENKGIECDKHKCCNDCKFRYINCDISTNEASWVNHKEMYNDKFLDTEIDEPDILSKSEKEYLKAVIKPFRNRVITISKCFYVFDNAYAIDICVMSSVGVFEKEITRLPLFRNEMYKGMAKNKAYTLEDLNL